MMENFSALAIVPKAKALGAQRLSPDDYKELMRRRSVLEVTTTLQNHPYFKRSLGGLAQTNLHRAQLEEALSKDVFFKYESLMRYSFRRGHFGSYFLVRCEINELLQKLRLMSMNHPREYIVQLPGFLTSKTSFSLLKLASAKTPAECLQVVAGTPYAHILQAVLPREGQAMDYLACEHALETYFYQFVLKKIDEDLTGAAAAQTRELFLCEAELYNLDLLFRAKAFFADAFPPARLRGLLIPVYGVLSGKRMRALADTPNLDAFLHMYNNGRGREVYGPRSANPQDASDVQEYRTLYRKAERLLHFSTTPQTVLAAVLCLANLERSNIITIIEGVRYGLAPEKIAEYLKN